MLESKNIHDFPELDTIDLAILDELGKNGRISDADLADKGGIAASTCLGRVRALVQAKVIKSFAAEVDPAALGLTLQALISVTLRAGARANLASFMNQMRNHPPGNSDFLSGGLHSSSGCKGFCGG
jgi:DNA-binding Lrp family transcriptional regulator